ncbi:MAG: hypothetical protein HY691_20660 [Chloroflexi bacterium]|nr:hypothetical protein [Chloroflexota bacterium]
MNVPAAVAAGLVATVVMTALMYVAPMMGLPKMDILGMLGSMLTPTRRPAVAIGTALHLMMGVVFALIYATLWTQGLGRPDWLWGAIFGVVHAVIAMMAMPMMMRMHPRPPAMAGGPMAAMGLVMGHVVYGVVVALVYAAGQ